MEVLRERPFQRLPGPVCVQAQIRKGSETCRVPKSRTCEDPRSRPPSSRLKGKAPVYRCVRDHLLCLTCNLVPCCSHSFRQV